MKSFKEFKTIDELPPKISVFPLPGALLLPRTQLPLNIFENRYLEMVDDAMSNNRLIAMIQSNKDHGDSLYKTGCLGKITSYSEVANSRMLITLSGVCRFNIGPELEVVTPYRQFQVNYEKFSSDLTKGHGEKEVQREKLIESLKKYLEHNNLTIDWDAINNSSTELLVNSLCILSPYNPGEKQALLEAETLSKRSEMLIAMTEMSMTSGPGTEQIQ
jgi:Lon protease-like protein